MKVKMKTELRTPGGETVGVFHKDRWIGDLYLIYREGDVLRGTVQIDTGTVEEEDLSDVFEQVKKYVSDLCDAMNIEDSSLVSLYGDIEQVIQMEAMDVIDYSEMQTEAPVMPEATDQHESPALPRVESAQVYATSLAENTGYYLTVSNQGNRHADYLLHDDFDNQIGLVAVDHIGDTLSGRVEFWVEPDKGETNEVARLLAKEFSDEADRVTFTMNWNEQHLGDIHLEGPEIF